jgi:hypothetical protein
MGRLLHLVTKAKKKDRQAWLLTGAGEHGFRVHPNPDFDRPSDELVALLNAHEDQLRALLDTALATVTWGPGDTSACVIVMPLDDDYYWEGDDERPFPKFSLPFPEGVNE